MLNLIQYITRPDFTVKCEKRLATLPSLECKPRANKNRLIFQLKTNEFGFTNVKIRQI
jgi:hypothetical protein